MERYIKMKIVTEEKYGKGSLSSWNVLELCESSRLFDSPTSVSLYFQSKAHVRVVLSLSTYNIAHVGICDTLTLLAQLLTLRASLDCLCLCFVVFPLSLKYCTGGHKMPKLQSQSFVL